VPKQQGSPGTLGTAGKAPIHITFRLKHLACFQALSTWPAKAFVRNKDGFKVSRLFLLKDGLCSQGTLAKCILCKHQTLLVHHHNVHKLSTTGQAGDQIGLWSSWCQAFVVCLQCWWGEVTKLSLPTNGSSAKASQACD